MAVVSPSQGTYPTLLYKKHNFLQTVLQPPFMMYTWSFIRYISWTLARLPAQRPVHAIAMAAGAACAVLRWPTPATAYFLVTNLKKSRHSSSYSSHCMSARHRGQHRRQEVGLLGVGWCVQVLCFTTWASHFDRDPQRRCAGVQTNKGHGYVRADPPVSEPCPASLICFC